MLKRSDVAAVLSTELIFFSNMPVTDELVTAWQIHFRHASPNEFATAFHITVNETKRVYAPTPGEVWATLRRLRATPAQLETADQAWTAVMSDKGVSARAHAAAEMMADWRQRSMWNVEHLTWKKKEFCKIYDDLKEQDEILDSQAIARTELGYGREALPKASRKLLEEMKCLTPNKP